MNPDIAPCLTCRHSVNLQIEFRKTMAWWNLCIKNLKYSIFGCEKSRVYQTGIYGWYNCRNTIVQQCEKKDTAIAKILLVYSEKNNNVEYSNNSSMSIESYLGSGELSKSCQQSLVNILGLNSNQSQWCVQYWNMQWYSYFISRSARQRKSKHMRIAITKCQVCKFYRSFSYTISNHWVVCRWMGGVLTPS